MNRLRQQYRRFPYPPIPWFALPALSPDSTPEIRFPESHHGIRILVLGAGTFEALQIAALHPQAAEVVALDFSETSLKRLAKRVRAWKFLRPWKKTAPINPVCADMNDWHPENQFDYIIASNVLHHLDHPELSPLKISEWLKADGILRVVTYPKQSRIWMRETSRYLSSKLGQAVLSDSPSNLVSLCRSAIAELPANHVVRSCFESQPETGRIEGLIDAFFNANEKPLSPLEWRAAFSNAGLELYRESQTETSRSTFLDELLPSRSLVHALDPWTKLQILDDVLELCANPVLWLRPVKRKTSQPVVPEKLAGNSRTELKDGLKRAKRLLDASGSSLAELIDALRNEVGPRVTAPRKGAEQRILAGLSILDYVDEDGEPLDPADPSEPPLRL